MGLTIFHRIFPDISTFRLNVGIFCGILSIPQNIVMDLNDVRNLVIQVTKLWCHLHCPKFAQGIGKEDCVLASKEEEVVVVEFIS